ncbi:MAG: PIN domain-containing protein [Verrucomicrobiales bacterium]
MPDPEDDLVLELALAGGAPFIITHNIRDFQDVDALGIQAVTPDDFLSILSTT